MSAVVAAHVILTVILYLIRRGKTMTWPARICVGIIFGLASIASTHFGINYGDFILNVSDMSPMTAGLLFDPVSGIIAGLMGAIGRYIAGTYYNAAPFTATAGTAALILSGFWAAILYQFYFRKEIPDPFDAFFMGATVEVFHLYAVYFTASGSVKKIFHVVNTNSLPMICFTGSGIALCSVAALIVTGNIKNRSMRQPKKDIPLSETFQFWMTFFCISVFCFNYGLSFGLFSARAQEEAEMNIITAFEDISDGYERIIRTDTDVSRLRLHVGGDKGGFDIIDQSNKIVAGTHIGAKISKRQMSRIRSHHFNENFEDSYFYVNSLCRTNIMSDGNILVVYMPKSEVYEQRDILSYQSLYANILMLTLVLVVTSILVRRIMVSRLDKVNDSLHEITDGNLDEKVSVYTSKEFTFLTDDINKMVDTLESYIDAAEKRVEQELISARTIQEAALPQNFDFPRQDLKIYATMTPAKAVGGDFYDFFFVDKDTMALVIADVSGKGIPASLFMMRSKTAVRTAAEKGGSPEEILKAANLTLCEGNSAHMFVSVWIGIIDLKTGVMRCANAGHEYPCFRRKDSRFYMIEDKHSPVLALFKRSKPKEYELHLSPGDRIFVYTDGIPEAIDSNTEAYGNERLLSILNKTKDLPLREALEGVLDDIHSFAAGVEQFDDITMLAFEYNKQAE